MVVGHDLLDRRLRPGGAPGEAGAEGAQLIEPQNLGLAVRRREAVAQHRVRHAAAAFHKLDQLLRGRAEAPQHPARRESDPLVGQRHLGQAPAVALGAHPEAGRQPDVVEEHLVEGVGGGHVHDGLHRHAGGVHGADEIGDAPVLGHVRVRAGDEDPEIAVVGSARPDLRAVHHVGVAVAHGPGGQRGQIRSGVGLAEELAPVLLAAEDWPQVASLLLGGASHEDRGRGPADTDQVVGPLHACGAQLLVDYELMQAVGLQPPGTGPVRHHVPGLGQLQPRGVRMIGQPAPDRNPAGIVVIGKIEVHLKPHSRLISAHSQPPARRRRRRGGSPRFRGWAGAADTVRLPQLVDGGGVHPPN